MIRVLFMMAFFWLCLSCSASQDQNEPNVGLSIDGLTIFGYENNQLSYHLKSQRMSQSIDKDKLLFQNFILQKIVDHQIDGVYIASDVVYNIKNNDASFHNANFEYHKGNLILNAAKIDLDLGKSFLTADSAQVIRSDQKIAAQILSYDLITNELIMRENVEGQYLGANDDN